MSRLLSRTVGWRNRSPIWRNGSQNAGILSVRWRTQDRLTIYRNGTGSRFAKMREALSRFGAPLLDLPPHDGVTLARRFFQPFTVNNANVAPGVRDEPGFLQHACRHGHARAPGSQHLRQQVLGQGDGIRSDAFGAHQQPSRQSLFHFMQAIAGCDLRGLHGHDLSKLLQPLLQHRTRPK